MKEYVDELRSLIFELGNAVKDDNYYKGYHWMSSKEQVYESKYECINDILGLMKDAIENISDANEKERVVDCDEFCEDFWDRWECEPSRDDWDEES